MIISSINVKNFRSIYDETLYFNNLTALLGPNGAGKSSFLKALDFFYNPETRYSKDDFYNKDTGTPENPRNIEITITYSEMNNYEKNRFQKYVKDNKLIVKKIFEWPRKKGSQRYYGKHLQNPDFDKFRNVKGAAALRKEYKELQIKYHDLPDYTTKDTALLSLKESEELNPSDCTLKQDEGQFFGFHEVGKSKLEEFTRFIYIPAVHDASEEATDNKQSVFTQIMDLVVRGALSQKKEFTELETNFQEKYDNFIEDEEDSLKKLKADINKTLGIYVPNATVAIDWQHENIKLPTPTADLEIIEDGYSSSVERCGHGLQRAYIMSMFQYLAKITSQNTPDKEEGESAPKIPPTIVIGIEEPEIYQHPNMQRYLSRILNKLAEGSVKGVAEKFQIVFSTHSPLFVNIENFESIRRLNKYQLDEGKPNITHIDSTNFAEVVDLIANCESNDSDLTPHGFKGRIKAIMTPWMNEGFFADMIVLVEGVTDRAAIIGYSKAIKNQLDKDMEVNGISVIPCMGKNSMHQPYAIFTKLNIPVYCIWDSDFKKFETKNENKQQKEIDKHHRLLKLCGHAPEDWPNTVTDNHACFHNNLEDTLRSEIGKSVYDQIVQDCVNFYSMSKRDAIKRPKVVERLVKKSKSNGNSSETLENIIEAIYDMRKSIAVHTSETTSEIPDDLDNDLESAQVLDNVNENASLDQWL